MQTQQRGRAVPQQRSPLPFFYGLLVIIALVGGLLLVLSIRSRTTNTATPINTAVQTLNAPTGTTAEGFAYKGSADAPVKVVEYADYQCPACGQVFKLLEPTIDRLYIETGKVQFVFHDFPLPMHANAVVSAAAARSAGAQGKYWAMHNLLFSRQSEWSNDPQAAKLFAGYAAELGLDRTAFEQSLNSGIYTAALQQAASAAEQSNITGTPTYVVNGTPVDAGGLQAAIEAALAAKGR